ncbi:MAG: daunorubicin resistance protein DrrA family ABC transporter ATP-binding protein [Thermodesulfobacteriota bacterium]|nr:MAG: daunorubicin resistance protein DrrA family ABC transporter ATP-binding protein [Thermodesulfobacteriota bacterium]
MLTISVENLVKRYSGVEAVRGVSFEVEGGETFGFLGPNGAGKTTTINILCTLLNFDSGTVMVNGYDCKKNSRQVRSSIGLVFQEFTLDNQLTAYENLKFHCYMYNMDKKTMNVRIDEILDVVGLSERRGDLVKDFSGGMKRRLEVGRGLLHRPKVLFLDEPTLGLDPQTRSHVWEFIERLKKNFGNTVFMTTHYMDEAEVCDRIAIIDNGRIIACASPEELKRSVKGDTVYLKTSDDGKAASEIEKRFGLKAKIVDGQGIVLLVEGGEKFIPRLFEAVSPGIISVNLKRPSLEEVFIHLTGRAIRDGARPRSRG